MDMDRMDEALTTNAVVARILLKATSHRPRPSVELAVPSPEESHKIVRQSLRKVARNSGAGTLLQSILSQVLSNTRILMVRNPSKLPASFVRLCHADALLEGAIVASEKLRRTREETQGQLAASALVSHKVSDIGVLLEELETIFEHELQVAELRATLIAQREHLLECIEAELEIAAGSLH